MDMDLGYSKWAEFLEKNENTKSICKNTRIVLLYTINTSLPGDILVTGVIRRTKYFIYQAN